MRIYWLSLFFIFAINSLFFRVDAMLPTTAPKESVSSIVGTWSMPVSKGTFKINQYVTYENIGNYSHDKEIKLASQRDSALTKSGQYGLLHAAQTLQRPYSSSVEQYKAIKLPGIWMQPNESNSLFYELMTKDKSSLNDFLTFLKDPSKDITDLMLTKATIIINELTNESLHVTEPINPDGVLDPIGFNSFTYRKIDKTTVTEIDSFQSNGLIVGIISTYYKKIMQTPKKIEGCWTRVNLF